MKLIANNVLIKLTKNTEELQLAGMTFQIDTSYETQRHQRIVGEVIAQPDKLAFLNMDHAEMEWDTTIETQIGDEVILQYPDVTAAITEKAFYEKDGYLFVYVNYSALVVGKRRITGNEEKDFGTYDSIISIDGLLYEIIPLNGFILVEQDAEDYETQLILPEHLKENKALTGVIRFIGSQNSRYHDEYNSRGQRIAGDIPDNKFDLKVGDRIAFQQYADADLEYEMHRTFTGREGRFVRMQRNKILAKM